MEDLQNFLIKTITSYNLYIGFILGIIPWVYIQVKKSRQRRKVFIYLAKNTDVAVGKRFLLTKQICNGVNLTPSEVTEACYTSKKIWRNEGNSESWTVMKEYKYDESSPSIESW